MSAIAPAGKGGAGGGEIVQQIGNLVRFWVHYDTMLGELNKQIRSTRELKNNYEAQIFQQLRTANIANPVIQIAGGRITVAEERHSAPLSLRSLEVLLHQYYRQKPGTRDETADIMRFIRTNRTVDTNQTLRRTSVQQQQVKDDSR